MFRAAAILLLAAIGNTVAAQDIALVGGRLVDGTGAPPIEQATIVIRGGIIEQAGRYQDLTVPPGGRVMNVADKTILPGLVDTHVHFRLAGHGDYREWETEYPISRTREVVFPRTTRAALRAGVTSAQDLGAEIESIVRVRDQIRSGLMQGPRISIAGPVLCTPTRTQSSSLSPTDWWIVESAEDGRAKVRALAARGVDVIKLWDDNFSEAEFAALIDEAHTQDLRVAAHLLTVESMYRALKSGLGSRDTVHHVGASPEARYPDDLVELIVRQRVFLAPTIIAFDGFRQLTDDPTILDDPAWMDSLGAELYQDVRQSFIGRDPTESSLYEYAFNRRQTRQSKLRQLHEAGAIFVLGTDAGSRANPHHSAAWREMILMVEEIGMSNSAVIESATRLAAEAMGVDHQVGTIEPGKFADVIIVDGNPLQDMHAMRRIDHVIKGGVLMH